MPIYEYQCQACGSKFELIQSIDAKPPKKCETAKCKGKPKRVVSASGFILKGSGWYTSDYPSDARKKGWEEEGKQTKAPAPDSKPAEATGSADTPKANEAETPKASPAPSKPKNPYTATKKNKPKPKKSAAK